MKKKILLLLGLALILTGCGEDPAVQPTAQTERVIETTPPYTGETKTVWLHEAISRTDETGTSRTEYVYREDGTLSDVVMYDTEGQEQQRYVVTCDEYGNPTRWVMTVEIEDATVESAVEYVFDGLGRTVGTYAYTDGVLITSTENDFEGDLQTATTVKAVTQDIEQKTTYTYDNEGLLIRQDLYVDGTLTAYAVCTSDEQGRTTVSQGYDLEGNPTTAVTYTYEENKETRVSTDETGQVVRTQVMEYDEHGNLIKNTVEDSRGTATQTHTYRSVEVPTNVPRAAV